MSNVILCPACGPTERSEWARVFERVPVVHRGQVVGAVAVLRCRGCGEVTAVPTRA